MGNCFSDKKILISGGLGFIGSHLARRLVGFGANVTIIDSLIPEYGGNYHNVIGLEGKLNINISDVRDQHAMKHLIHKQDFLFNLAGQTSHMDSMSDPFTDLDINAKGQLSILESCRQHNPGIRIVFASTRQIYGRPDYLPVDEKHPIKPVDVNGINKISGELYHLLYNQVYGIASTVLRLTNTYGPCMRVKDARQTFLGIWVKQILQGKPFEVWGGEQLRDFNYVDDVVDAFLLASTNDCAIGKAFNLGSNEVVTLKQLAEVMIANSGGNYELKTFPEDRKKIDIGDYYSDFTLIKDTLGWQPKIALADGLARSFDYFKVNMDKYL